MKRSFVAKKALLTLAMVLLAGLAVAGIGTSILLFLGLVPVDKDLRGITVIVSLLMGLFFVGCFFGARQDYKELVG